MEIPPRTLILRVDFTQIPNVPIIFLCQFQLVYFGVLKKVMTDQKSVAL